MSMRELVLRNAAETIVCSHRIGDNWKSTATKIGMIVELNKMHRNLSESKRAIEDALVHLGLAKVRVLTVQQIDLL